MVTFTTKPPNYYNRNAKPVIPANATGASNPYYTNGQNQITRSANLNFGNNQDFNSQNNFVPPISIGPTTNQTTVSLTTATDSGVAGLSYSSSGYSNPSSLNPSSTRLSISNLPLGGSYNAGIISTPSPLPSNDVYAGFTESTERRVIISDQTGKFIGSASNFAPLANTNGVLFPYTPLISISHKANYELDRLIHTNYSTPYYVNSSVDNISIQGRFTANTPDEAIYILAMMHFFKTATKMFYGASTNKGTPPPVLYLDGYGQALLDHIPVVISDFTYNLPNEVHYISATYLGKTNKVPVDLNVTVSCIPTYSRNQISNNFSLDSFSTGGLLTSGTGSRKGGWI